MFIGLALYFYKNVLYLNSICFINFIRKSQQFVYYKKKTIDLE